MLSGGKLCRGLRSQTTFSCAHGPSLFSLRSCLAGLPAEAHAPMVIADKTKLSTTVCTAIFQLGHGVIFKLKTRSGPLSDARGRKRHEYCRSSAFSSIRLAHLRTDTASRWASHRRDALRRAFRQINVLQ